MKDKEQIIIDGVDVSGCKYYLCNTHKNCGVGLVDCEGKDCMFKQLARKTQECEELKKELVRCSKGLGKAACEKSWYQQAEQAKQEENHSLAMEIYSYRKALEEIEGIAKNFGSYAAWQEQRINKILDIINKAKGEE